MSEKELILDSYIGRLAVCQHGILGEADFYTFLPHTARALWHGRDIITGESWQALRPNFLDPEREKVVREALALLKQTKGRLTYGSGI